MKKTLLLLSFVVLLSCGDDDPAPSVETTTALVNRISRDGLTSSEFFYDVDKKLYRMNNYYLGTLSNYYLYDYSDDGPKESRRYKADHTLDYKTVFTLDNFGRIVKSQNFTKTDSFKEAVSSNTFEYDGTGQQTVRKFSSDGSSTFYREDHTYDTNGTLIKTVRTYYPNQPLEYIAALYEFTGASQTMPAEWKEHLDLLSVSYSDGVIREMFNASSHGQVWDDDGKKVSETKTEAAQQVFDEKGNLLSQRLTKSNILKPENPDVIDNMTYDYEQEH